ncbi:MAG TPA: thioredoxin domain-containing protein [Pyrinomonadaceae bacterium]|nr:thioredoxin domain-containing protein [Pyrinomonadaceae bacterium]
MSAKQSAKQNAAHKNNYAPLIIILAVLVAAVAAVWWMLRRDDSASSTPAARPTQTTNTPSSATPASGSAGPTSGNNNQPGGAQSAQTSAIAPGPPGAQPPRVRGADSAAVTLEEFGDYQCPPCGRVHPVLNKIERDYAGRVRIIFRHLPLQSIHKNASLAARAAEAAGIQGRFWEMHDKLYEHQEQWSEALDPRPLFAAYAAEIKIDVEKFKSDIDKPLTSSRIIADLQRADGLRVSGTPTIYLNGRLLTAEQTLEEAKLRAEIEAAVAAAGKGR